MRVFFVGEIVGRPGREIFAKLYPQFKKDKDIDFCIANGENAAGGSGLTPKIAEELFSYGIDVLTNGDHVWDKKEIISVLDKDERLLRPANYPHDAPGIGSAVYDVGDDISVGVINLIGRVFLKTVDCPFKVARKEVEKLKEKTNVIFVDFHAEATSEKVALGWYLDGEVSCVVGTHTHVQTADERILPGGTAYITDMGMTGPYDSVLGRRVDQIIARFLTQMPMRFEMASDNVKLCGLVVDVDEKTGKTNKIERIQTG